MPNNPLEAASYKRGEQLHYTRTLSSEPTLNYKRGFKRIFFVMIIFWTSIFSLLAIRERPGRRGTPAIVESSLSYWLTQLGIVTLPPIATYLSLFVLVPWIWGGFTPESQANEDNYQIRR